MTLAPTTRPAPCGAHLALSRKGVMRQCRVGTTVRNYSVLTRPRNPRNKMSEQRYRQNIKCQHCRNTVIMPIVARHPSVHTHTNDDHTMQWNEGYVYEILKCPACD